MYIVQFIPLPIAFSIINEYSTFCLRNITYFRNLEEQYDDQVTGDKKENIVEFQENLRHYELLATTLITCWTKLSSDSLDVSGWGIFGDRANGIAIVSTVECVREFLLRETDHILDKKVWHLEHGEVQYYDGFYHPPTFDTMTAPFWKRKWYEKQREYRFAFLSRSIRNIDTLIFYTRDPRPYIKKIYFGPSMEQSFIHKLRAQAIGAGLAGLIEHFDDMCKKP
jgi:hypothetical protein